MARINFIRFPLAAAMLAAMTAAGCSNARTSADEGEERPIALGAIPAPARETIEREARGATIEHTTIATEDGKTLYFAEFQRDGRDTEVEVYPDGKVCCVETEIAPSEVPEPVRRGVEREGARLMNESGASTQELARAAEFRRKLSDGATTYLVVFMVPRQQNATTIEFDPQGESISTVIEPESE